MKMARQRAKKREKENKKGQFKTALSIFNFLYESLKTFVFNIKAFIGEPKLTKHDQSSRGVNQSQNECRLKP